MSESIENQPKQASSITKGIALAILLVLFAVPTIYKKLNPGKT